MKNDRLIVRRKECGLTQREVAEEAKVTLREYCRYEKGEHTPRLKVAFSIADALD